MSFDNIPGVLAGGAIGFLSASLVSNRTALRAAGNRLRVAFAPELALVRMSPAESWDVVNRAGKSRKGGLDQILDDALSERHAAAIEEFRFFVPAREISAYDVAWKAYIQGDGANLGRYSLSDGRIIFISRVEEILSFTKLRWYQGWLG